MPVYDYRCGGCNKTWTEYSSGWVNSSQCPICGQVGKKIPTIVYVKGNFTPKFYPERD